MTLDESPADHLELGGLAALRPRIEEFCRRWDITALELFGSALRKDFDERSDVDFLVTFAAESRWSLLDLIRMEDELAGIVGRPVDLVTRRSIERSRNPLRRREILESARTIYAA